MNEDCHSQYTISSLLLHGSVITPNVTCYVSQQRVKIYIHILIILHLPSYKNTRTTALNRGASLGNRIPKVPDATTCSDSDPSSPPGIITDTFTNTKDNCLFINNNLQMVDACCLCLIFLVGVCAASTVPTVIPLGTEKNNQIQIIQKKKNHLNAPINTHN